MSKLATAFHDLTEDPWRRRIPFSSELASCHEKLFAGDISDDIASAVLREWLSRYQPCLFGRIAAKLDLLSILVLREDDLLLAETSLRAKIQTARTSWTRAAFAGTKSGFIIWLVSPRVTLATPNDAVFRLAKRIAELYLLREITRNQIYVDDIFLGAEDELVWKWNVGVNYFAAQGDGRWWQDHRIPGGLAFSMNSVGHLAKCGALARSREAFGAPQLRGSPVDSLPKGLELAMRTIHGASDARSGKATWLVPLRPDSGACPAVLPRFLQEKDFCEYAGYYHTDQTLPTAYFAPSPSRKSARRHALDFTYLFRDEVDNPDFVTTGAGRQVRAVRVPARRGSRSSAGSRRNRMTGMMVVRKNQRRLARALRGEPAP